MTRGFRGAIRGARLAAIARQTAAVSPSRHALQNMRLTVWQCLRCGLRHVKPTKAATAAGDGPGFVRVDERPKACASCAGTRIVKFDSKIEADYAAQLMLLQRARHITGLSYHPVLVVEIPPITPEGSTCELKYTADGTYLEKNGTRVYYDVKARGAPLERDFSLRRRIIEAAFGVKIQIVRK